MRSADFTSMFAGTFPQLLAVFTATINAISDGMQYGWSAPIIPLLQSPETPVVITDSDIVWLEATCMMGAIAGLPITIFSVDKFGRQKSILLACVTGLVAWILIGVATRVELLFVGRFVTGIAGDVAFVSAPMYIAEISDQKIRGFLAACIYVMMLIGVLLIYSIGPFVPVYASSAVGASFLIFQLFTFPFMPESPYYLLLKNQYDKARSSLQRLRGTDDVDTEMKEIAAAVERQKSERGKPQDLLLVKSNRKALLIICVLNASQHFGSISVILMNLHTILAAAGSIYLETRTAAIVFSALLLMSCGLSSFLVDRFGRKVLLVCSSLFTGFSLGVLATFFAVKSAGVDVDFVSWIPIASIMVYAIVFKFGLGMIPIVMTGELFPTSVKAMGMTISDASYVGFALLSLYMYQYLATYGQYVPFFISSASCVFVALFSVFVIPETKGKTLEEIQFILKGLPYEGKTINSQPVA